MPDRCVVAGCSNVPNSEKGIALHKFPFFGDDRNMAKAPVPRFHRNTFEQEELSDRSRRQV